MLAHTLLLLMPDAGGATPLVATEFGTVAVTFYAVTLTWDSATGGTAPYTYVLYRSTTEGFTPGPGDIVAQGIDALTYTDSSGLSQGVVYHYRLGTIDAADTEALGSAEVSTGLAWDGTGIPVTTAEGYYVKRATFVAVAGRDNVDLTCNLGIRGRSRKTSEKSCKSTGFGASGGSSYSGINSVGGFREFEVSHGASARIVQ